MPKTWIKTPRPLWPGGPAVFPLVFGSLTVAPLQCGLPDDQAAELMAYAHSRGVNLVDTAECYGNYATIRKAKQLCPDLMICTKTYAYEAQGALESFQKACQEIGVSYIDIFLLHEQESQYTIRGHKPALDMLDELRRQGKIGAVGISTHHVAAVVDSLRFPQIQVIHPIYNMAGIGVVDGTAQQMRQAIAQAKAAGKGIYAMKALGGGHLIANVQQALEYVWQDPAVDAAAVGMQCRQEVDYNLSLLAGQPDTGLAAAIGGRTRRLLIEDWCEGCGNCVQRCPFGALEIDENTHKAVVDHARCTRCGYCAGVCPGFYCKVV